MNAVYISLGILVLLTISVKSYQKKKRRNKVICVVESNCTGCRRCIKRCTRRVLETVNSKTGIHAAVKYPDKCTACGDCLGKCKFNALKIIERI